MVGPAEITQSAPGLRWEESSQDQLDACNQGQRVTEAGF